MVTRAFIATIEIEEVVNRLTETLQYAAWNDTPRRTRITDACNSKIYPLNNKIQSMKTRKQDKYGSSQGV